ncbi:MAG: alpha/beta hydrolase [Candidatus Omnitrophica bacterium]|nr:alpha/beta hydrolase [Candidatus Omnitrophota bacterium]MCM8803044.1 alpha/beta hydrolase [Candidatus Omnitrophota bacterium]
MTKPIPIWAPCKKAEFKEGDVPTITPYLVKGKKNNSCIIVFPGGGYVTRAPHEREPIALWLNKIGISSFLLDYRVSPYKYPIPFLDAKRSIKFVRYNAKKFNIDPDRIGIIGFSAGGHLASLVGVHFDYGEKKAEDPVEKISSRPNLLILCYPVISFVNYPHQGCIKNLIGDNTSKEILEYLSSEKNVRKDTPFCFIWHTQNDQVVPVFHSILFSLSLKEKNINFQLHIFDNGPHGLGLAENNPSVSKWTLLCEEWLKENNF